MILINGYLGVLPLRQLVFRQVLRLAEKQALWLRVTPRINRGYDE